MTPPGASKCLCEHPQIIAEAGENCQFLTCPPRNAKIMPPFLMGDLRMSNETQFSYGQSAVGVPRRDPGR